MLSNDLVRILYFEERNGGIKSVMLYCIRVLNG